MINWCHERHHRHHRGERRFEHESPPAVPAGLPRHDQHGMGRARRRDPRPPRGRAVRREAPRGAERALPGAAPRDPRRRLRAALERHRFPVPRALGVRAPDRVGRRFDRRFPARVRALGERARRDAVPARPRHAHDARVLSRRRDRRVLGGSAPFARGRLARSRDRDRRPVGVRPDRPRPRGRPARRAHERRERAAAREGRLRGAPDAARRGRDRAGVRRHRARAAARHRARARRAHRRRRLPPACAQRRQLGGLRHDRGVRPPRVLSALDPQRRCGRPRRSHARRRGRRARQPVHGGHHAHDPGERALHPDPAHHLRGGARGGGRGLRRGGAGHEVPRPAQHGDGCDRRAHGRMGPAARDR